MEQTKNDVLKVKRLHVEFQTSHGMVHAVKDVSLEVKRGRIHALVGESGSGKSVTSLTIMNLLAGNGKVISGNEQKTGKGSSVGKSADDESARSGRTDEEKTLRIVWWYVPTCYDRHCHVHETGLSDRR